MEKDDKKIPTELFDFCDGNPKLSNFQSRKKLTKQFIRTNAKDRLKEFFRLLMKSLDKNSIELSRVSAFANTIWKELEEEGICYSKKMPNGKIRIFKNVYCCSGLEAWKNCPEYKCPIWPCDIGLQCPHEREEILRNMNAEITLNNKQGKHSGVDKKESPE